MGRILGNIFKSIIVIAMGAVMGYYSFENLQWWGVITACYFTVIGWLLAKSWTSPEKNKSDVNLEMQSLNGTVTNASAVAQKGMIDNVAEYTPNKDGSHTESVESN